MTGRDPKLYRDLDPLRMEWLIVGVQQTPGRCVVYATRSVHSSNITVITGGARAGERVFEARSSDMVTCEGRTYAEAMTKLGQRWDADDTRGQQGSDHPALEQRFAIGEGR